MKKLVPDPPQTPFISPTFTHDKAIQTATDYIDKAIDALDRLPDHVVLEKQPDLGDAILDLKVGKAFLMVALGKTLLPNDGIPSR